MDRRRPRADDCGLLSAGSHRSEQNRNGVRPAKMRDRGGPDVPHLERLPTAHARSLVGIWVCAHTALSQEDEDPAGRSIGHMHEDIHLDDGCIARVIATYLDARGQYTF